MTQEKALSFSRLRNTKIVSISTTSSFRAHKPWMLFHLPRNRIPNQNLNMAYRALCGSPVLNSLVHLKMPCPSSALHSHWPAFSFPHTAPASLTSHSLASRWDLPPCTNLVPTHPPELIPSAAFFLFFF